MQRRSAAPRPRNSESLGPPHTPARSLAGATPRRFLGAGAARGAGVVFGAPPETQLLGDAGVAVFARDRQLQHARHVPLAEDRIAEQLVVHVAAFGGEPGILDVADDLDFVHAVGGAGRPHDVLFDHHAAHVVGAVGQTQLTDFAALRDPGRLHVVEVVEHDAADRQRAQIVDAGRFGPGELGVIGLIAPGDKRREATGFVLQRAQPQHVLDPLFVGFHRPVHHRRGGAQPSPVRVAHDVEPLVSRRLAVAVQQLADAVDQDFGAAAGDTVHARGNQSIEHRGHRQLREAREMDHFGRRQRVQFE